MLRSVKKYRRIVPALVGTAALVVAVLALQAGTESKGSAEPKLAAAQRTADATASRGAGRTGAGTLADQIAQASANGAFGSPTEAADATTTTTTAAPTTTTTAAPAPTTTAKPVVTTAKPKPTPPTTEKPKPTPVTTAKPQTQPAPSGSANAGDVCRLSPGAWCSLAKCESGDRNVNTGNGYYGYFQFSASTWRAMGGSGLPSDNSAATQLALAQKLQARSGWGQWPVCGRGL